MKKRLLFLLCLGSRLLLPAQELKPGSIVQSQALPDGHIYSLVADSGWNQSQYNVPHLSLLYSDYANEVESSTPLNFLDTALTGNPLTEINLHFTDVKTGFLYGYETGYGYLNFLFRTEDAGKTWRRIELKGIGYSAQLMYDDFFMFNAAQGVIVSLGNYPTEFHYYLTSDGGKNWEEYTYQLPKAGMLLANGDVMMKTSYSKDGLVTLMITLPDDNDPQSVVTFVLRSTNFGASFHEMK